MSRLVSVGTLITVVATLTACGESRSPVSPRDGAAITGQELAGAGGTSGNGGTVPFTGGKVRGLSGICPNLSFSLPDRSNAVKNVRTNSATTFEGKACADLRNDDGVGVAGTTQADGSILATKVYAGAWPGRTPPPSGGTMPFTAGKVKGLSGSCPSLSFSVPDRSNAVKNVRTNSATTFEGKACADLRNDDGVGVAGTTQADGSILATKVYAGAWPGKRS